MAFFFDAQLDMEIDARDLGQWCTAEVPPKHAPCTYGEELRRLLNMNYNKDYKASKRKLSDASDSERHDAVTKPKT